MLTLPPFHVGETATLWAPRELSVTITPPGAKPYVIASPQKRIDIPLPVVGTWTYEFSDGASGEIVVLEATPPTVVP